MARGAERRAARADDREAAARIAELEHLISARQARREGAEIRFTCPAHADAHPSARWHPGKRTWFCDACRTGGGWLDLARRLGLGEERPRRVRGEVVATYAYRDAAGRLLYEVLRKSPKSFVCRRPDGAGGWLWNLKGVERVLYRLPEVAVAVGSGEPVFVVEGEKDAEAVAALGLCATTSSGGAGKWRDEYAEALHGAAVVLVPDKDEAGWGHAMRALTSLQKRAREVRMLELPGLPAKGDVSDWIAERERAGLGREEMRRELERLGQAAPLWASSSSGAAPAGLAPAESRRLREVAPETIRFLWEPYIPLGKVTLLEGDPGQGKSWIAAALAASGSLGSGLPGVGPFPPFCTLFFTAEDGIADTLRPRLDRMGADTSRIYAHDLPLRLNDEEGLARLEREIAARRPRLVVIDPVVAYIGARTDIYRANEVRSVLAPLARLAEKYGCAILVIRHLNKAKVGRSIYAGQGSIDFTAAARSVLLAGSAADDPGEHALLHIKSNLAPSGPALGYRIENGRFFWTGMSRLTAGDLLAGEAGTDDRSAENEAREFLRELLREGPVAVSHVLATARRAGISEKTLRRAKRKEGVVAVREGYGAAGGWLWAYPGASKDGQETPKMAT